MTKRYTDQDRERFWAKVEKGDHCWEWIGYRRDDGYGELVRSRQRIRAHVYSWLIAGNDIPSGMCICHRCDNPTCVRPQHLFLGSHLENMRDMVAKGRHVPLPGSKNKRSKLREGDIPHILSRWIGGESQSSISRDYGVSSTTIYRVIHGLNWKQVLNGSV